MASSKRRSNRITYLIDREARLDNEEGIIKHIEDYFVKLYRNDPWATPRLDNMEFDCIGAEHVQWLEREFEEEEIWEVVFGSGGEKALSPDGFPMAFFQRFWGVLKGEILAFMQEFHARG